MASRDPAPIAGSRSDVVPSIRAQRAPLRRSSPARCPHRGRGAREHGSGGDRAAAGREPEDARGEAFPFNETLEDTTALYTDDAFGDQLASSDELSIFAIGDTASGTSPTITVQIEESPDQIHWSNKATTAEINAIALSTTAITTRVARDNGSTPSNGFIRFRVQLGGTSPKAHIRIWATGRSEA